VEPTTNHVNVTHHTLSADDVIGEIIESNNAFIPIAAGPHGEFGSLFRRFIEGTNPIPISSFPVPNRPNSKMTTEIATQEDHSISLDEKIDNGNITIGPQ
jgi:hypothetical protein